jgi:hypothetical protein
MPIALRLNRRIDGSLVLKDAYDRAGPLRGNDGAVIRDEREFPAEHWFRYDWLLATPEATVDGDVVRLELANATAVYRVTEAQARGYAVTLESSELRDPPPLDEAKAEANRAIKEGRTADALALTDQAAPGTPATEEA